MLSSEDIEKLLSRKKREIQKEKTLLGLSSSQNNLNEENNKENDQNETTKKKQVIFKGNRKDKILQNQNENSGSSDIQNVYQVQDRDHSNIYELEEHIPPDLERYIRRYVGLPVMLKAGEYSPNNPLVRAERPVGGDALLGLGEYERRRNTLRKYRQAQYRQYLDQQAQKKQEAKEQAERERREREEKEKEREERERRLVLERDSYSPEQRRASVCSVPISTSLVQTTKVDTGVQVDGVGRPLSVAVQTDDVELYRLSPSPSHSPLKCLTEAERELSPRTVAEPKQWNQKWDDCGRRRSYGDYDERTSSIKKSNRDKLVSDLRHTYMPSIFDADAIQMRNLQAEKEAAERRQFYQQELKNQILEQQRIREERKSREKMLEQAEMRRLEEQLRMLRVAQETEIDRNHNITAAMRDNAKEYHSKRTDLQRVIDSEQKTLLRATTQPAKELKRTTNTSKSDTQRSKLPFYYTEKTFKPIDKEKKPYSFNIPDNSIFSSSYDVDSYLRKNLNFKDKIDLDIETINSKTIDKRDGLNIDKRDGFNIDKRDGFDIDKRDVFNIDKRDGFNIDKRDVFNIDKREKLLDNKEKKIITEKALIHDRKEIKNSSENQDFDLPIPVLRHSPKNQAVSSENESNLSEAMKKVDDKWKVPAVQKNILKSLSRDDGKNVNILTQLGSIRRQLQLEQLRLDKMLTKDGF